MFSVQPPEYDTGAGIAPPRPPPMTLRPAFLAVAAALLAAAACAPETALVSAGAAPQLARGGGGGGSNPPAAILSVAGTWSGTYRRTPTPGDTTQWSLNLQQRGDRLDGGLIRIAYLNGAVASASGSQIKSGGVVGQSVTVSFAGGEGAETKPTFSAAVSADGRRMTGSYSYLPNPITLTRR